MRLTEEDMQARREIIIHNAFLLFSKQGIEAVRLSEIAKHSHVSENTVYRYFGNKENLVLEAFIRLWDNIMTDVERSVEATENYQDQTGYVQLRVWLESFRQLYRNNKDFVLFSYEAKLYLVRHKVRLNKFQQDVLMQPIRTPCLSALEKGKQDGTIPVAMNSEDLFYAIWGTIRGYVVKIVIYDALYGADSPWEQRYPVVVNGILSALQSGWAPERDPV